jgi:DNA-binding transcriptional LysR family regulator
MDLLQLEHFLAVAEEGSFTRAAARCGAVEF